MTLLSRLAAVAGLTVALVVAGGLALHYGSAQEEGSPPPDASPRTEFVERVAEKLGVSSDELRQAVKDAALELIDEKVAEGRLTEERAERLRERIESSEGAFPFGAPFHRGPRHDGRHEGARGMLALRPGFIESVAEALGLEPRELLRELRDGKSLADVAAERGVDAASLIDAAVASMEQRLAEAVADGRITQERAEEILAGARERLEEALTP